ncbi:ATPase domain-containing protein [Halorubellus litoreus]|uniref:non-specific serine/threonine protein kinase n=1 Tax=Halorubellus litoreus TaxID=755308 RepID=A0ABD5VHG9_9EURY
MTSPTAPTRITTGIDSLDEVLDGGLIPTRAYMLTGDPGTGKTILGLHYLTAGRDAGETALCVNLEESTEDIRQNAASLGFDLDGIEFLDLTPSSDAFGDGQRYDIFSAAETEGPEIAAAVTDAIEEHDPDRVFVDPLSRFRHLAPDDHQFRELIGSFVQLLRDTGATVLFTTQATAARSDADLQYLSDGTIALSQGAHGRELEVKKFRGSDSARGPHTFRITPDGLALFPELVPGTHSAAFDTETISSGIPEVDDQLHGGIERGTVTILSGPTGVGKTTLGTQFMKEAAERGERSVIYMFEENTQTFLERSEQTDIPVTEMRDRGTLEIAEMEPLRISSSEFAARVREEVEANDAEIVMIDGIDGYRLSLRGQKDDLRRELHSLCRYLKNMGVTVILVDATESVTGDFKPTAEDVSYLADNLVFLRYLEMQGELRKALGILKKRTSDFERTLREFEITDRGIEVGEPLRELRGVLKGTPDLVDPGDETVRPPDGEEPDSDG